MTMSHEAQAATRAGSAVNPVERLREIIRAEIARANPLEESRRALELIVETSVRAEETPDGLKIAVVDQEGRRRTTRKDGREVDLTIPDLVEELRQRHPRLFAAPIQGAQAAAAAAAGLAGADAGPSATPPGAHIPKAETPAAAAPDAPRDLLILAPKEVERPARTDRAQAGRFGALRTGPAAVAAFLAPTVRRGVARFGALRRPARKGERGSAVGLPVVRSRFGGRTASILAAVAVAIPLLGVLGASLVNDASAPPSQTAKTARAPGQAAPAVSAPEEQAPAESASAAPEAETTGTVQGQDPLPAGAAAGTLRGVAEVLDTATLSVQGTVVRLFGVEWAKGAGDPDDLASYLRGREVTCRPEGTTDKHRCEVGGVDLSKVVLFNGGGRATAEASPDLKAAEEHARSQQIGVWGAESVRARP